ncbi:hypothetical protein MPEAHAMD_2541 [Methylobacterium frigidaeris]|jgi:hypothetical protein|uniref:Uncharacterized protein n=1 Tax=Methylobacterium frigidaeris TaxID=2038277 RepID=A0AA37HAF5_9HYPH|nr:hypothetical protein MPEAHAMD_2541 [Methylobacterium frigidaeris]
MTVQARRMFDFSESATTASSEEIRAHVRAQLDKLVSALKPEGVRLDAA